MPIEPDQIRRALTEGDFSTVFQPIYSLRSGTVVGLEALTRFPQSPLGPGSWFAAAHQAGLGVELELATARRALEAAAGLPEQVRLWINLSPAALVDKRTPAALASSDAVRLGVEVTEQAPAAGYAQLQDACRALQRAGLRLGVDDVGGTPASVRNLWALRPDEVKIDLSLTASLEQNRRGRARARRTVATAHRQGAAVVAEGVETPWQLRCWDALGADAVQGFLLAVPAPLPEALSSGPIVGTGEGAPARSASVSVRE